MTACHMIILQISFLSVCMDIQTEKIANCGICIFWLVGFCYQIWLRNLSGICDFAAGAAVPILLLAGLFMFRMLGPGDIKLFSALGGVMGVLPIVRCMICSFLIGAVLSAAVILLCGNAGERLRYFTAYISQCCKEKRIHPYYRTGRRMENIHFSVPVFLAVVLYTGGFY
ncbi:prepilin peptidase [Ruminococcus sp. OA3]|uniref:prepilin peptidase n=1 Tax=Ruminococcus sp. OA3 TaxID=2914164 RepID=UPI001F05E7BD|nr:prepilin peptidase [Ruminococcus sp. OA3]MCH1981116.1 prepilin peptidase [Ruminococcus sp. OA3]